MLAAAVGAGQGWSVGNPEGGGGGGVEVEGVNLINKKKIYHI